MACRRGFVTVDRCQLLCGTLVVLEAGLARRLGGYQWHGGRAGQVAWLQEERVVTVAILWRSWGTMSIRNLKYPQQLLFTLLLHKHLFQLLVEPF